MIKKLFLLTLILLCTAGLCFAQQTIKGMALNGVTGLIATPTAQIGWERTADIGVDFGYHLVSDDGITHIPKVAISLFKKAEIAVAYDSIGSDRYGEDWMRDTDPQAFLVNGKFQFYKEGVSAVAVGGSFQYVDDFLNETWNAGQVYLVATYSGEFFGMPAATSLTIGKSFSSSHAGYELVQDSDIDFSMGFELTLFPSVLKNYIQWINDFSNYSYSVLPAGSFTERRGSYNTGLRIDPLKNQSFKLVVDVILADVFDDDDPYDAQAGGGRSFIFGATFGMALK
jgi:hypothetical protein